MNLPAASRRGISWRFLIDLYAAENILFQLLDFLHIVGWILLYRFYPQWIWSTRLTRILHPRTTSLPQVLGQRFLAPWYFSQCEQSLSEHRWELIELESVRDPFQNLFRESESEIFQIFLRRFLSEHFQLFQILQSFCTLLDRLDDISVRIHYDFCGCIYSSLYYTLPRQAAGKSPK